MNVLRTIFLVFGTFSFLTLAILCTIVCYVAQLQEGKQ